MPNDSLNSGFFASRPVIRLDDEIEAALGEHLLLSLLVEETTMGLFRCEMHFRNWGPKDDRVDFLLFDRDVLDFGKEVSVELGAPGAERQVFTGRITGIEAHYPPQRAPELTVLAEDRFQDLRMERRTRSFENATDSDVIQRIASRHGLTAQVDIDGPTYPILIQLNQSDLAFLRERAAAADAALWIEESTLYVVAHDRHDVGTVAIDYGRNLLEFTVLADLAHQRSAVSVGGWDVSAKEAIDEEATESAVSGELGEYRSGAGVLSQALAERSERFDTAVPLNRDEARQVAQVRYRARARRFLCGTGIADGNPAVRVGATAELNGLGELFDGDYYVTRVRHIFDLEQGFRTSFDVERPGLGG